MKPRNYVPSLSFDVEGKSSFDKSLDIFTKGLPCPLPFDFIKIYTAVDRESEHFLHLKNGPSSQPSSKHNCQICFCETV